MALSMDALVRHLGSKGAEINKVEARLKCLKHFCCLIEISLGTSPRGREGGKVVVRAATGDTHR